MRFNSAVRYAYGRSDCMVVVKSEDGMVNLFPSLRPQISQAELNAARTERHALAAKLSAARARAAPELAAAVRDRLAELAMPDASFEVRVEPRPDGCGPRGADTVEVTVANTGDRPIQIGSHFHFFEVNRALRFERALAFGMRLNVPAGTAVRFEPGDEKRVTLVELGGARRVFGLNALTEGGGRDQALAKLAAWERRS